MKFDVNAFEIFDKDWALLTAGNAEKFNAMTISWGGLGTLWGKPVVTVYVKPVRYTHIFMENSDFFTVSFYGEQYRRALTLLGSLSGRDGDKIKACGLTAVPCGDAVTFKEARATLVCKKIYRQDLDISRIPQDAVKAFYAGEAPHTMYIGEVIGASVKA